MRVVNFNYLKAEISANIPLKKPILSGKEIEKKISINILKPLKKPKNKKMKKKLKLRLRENLVF